MNLVITVNETLASWIAGEEGELCLLNSKIVLSKVIICIVMSFRQRKDLVIDEKILYKR